MKKLLLACLAMWVLYPAMAQKKPKKPAPPKVNIEKFSPPPPPAPPKVETRHVPPPPPPKAPAQKVKQKKAKKETVKFSPPVIKNDEEVKFTPPVIKKDE